MARQTFISYSKKDSKFALKLCADLETAGHRIWVDREKIGGGQQWRRTIEQALNESAEMVVVISPNSAASRWVQHESSAAYASGKPIIPVLIEPVPSQQNFVWMDEIQYIDFTAQDYDVALAELLKALQPPNPIQDLLDQQVVAYRQTGDLMGEALLALIEENRDKVVIPAEAAELIAASQKEVRFRRQLLRGGIGLVALLAFLALIAVGASYEASRNVQNSLATNRAAQTRIADVETQGAAVGARATAQALEATVQGGTARAEIAAAQTKAAEVEGQAAQARTEAAEAARKVLEAEEALKDVFDESGLAVVARGPRALIRAGALVWVVNRDANSIQSINPVSGRVGQPLPVGKQPVAIAYDGRSLWVANQADDTLSRIDLVTRQITSYPAGDGPRALLFAGGSLWLANEYENTVKRISIATGEVEAVIEVQAGPVALAYDGANVWVASYSANLISRISPTSLRVTRTIAVEGGPGELLWDGESLWVANRGADSVQVVDTRNSRVSGSISVADAPAGLAFDGTNIWVAARGADLVQLVDRNSTSVLASYRVGDFPSALLWDGSTLWLANLDDDTVQKINRASGAVAAETRTGGGPAPLALARGSLWVGCVEDGFIQQIDLKSKDVVASVPLAGVPASLAYDGRRLWVADFANDRLLAVADLSAATPVFASADVLQSPQTGVAVGNGPADLALDGGSLWVANQLGDSVMAVDLEDLSVIGEFPVGDQPTALVVVEEFVWVSHRGDGTIRKYSLAGEEQLALRESEAVIADLTWDGASLWAAVENKSEVLKIDPDTGDILLRVAVGEAPVQLAVFGEWLLVLNRDSDSVQVIEPESGVVAHSLDVGNAPTGLAGEGDKVWISLRSDSAVQEINLYVLRLISGAP